MNVKEFCLDALADTAKHKRMKDGLLLKYVELRLERSLDSYQKDISSATDYLENRKLLNLARKITKYD